MLSEIEAERHVTWQPSLLSTADPDFDPTLARAQRRSLGRGAWVDLVPGWVSEPDALFEQVLVRAPWTAFERPMYDRVVEVPRLETRTWHDRPALIDRMARCLGRRYGVRFAALSANLYRDGRDSVAWHGDRIGRHRADAVGSSCRWAPPAPCCCGPTVAGRPPPSRSTRAICWCRAAPASAPSSTACPSERTPAPASA